MAENNEINLKLRHAEAEHLLEALDLLPAESKKSITHQTLHRQLTIIKDHWEKAEKARKAMTQIVRTHRLKKLKS